MAYFLKKTKLKNRTYLAIYESFYNHAKKATAHKCFQSLGSVETLMEHGIKDPISHFQKEVDELNRKKKEAGTRKISEKSSILYLGYFPLKNIMDKLNIKKYVDFFKFTHDFEYDLFELISSLVYARSVNPCSKNKTFHEVIPNLYHSYSYSYDQLLGGLAFLGNNYEKFIEIFTTQVGNIYGIDTSKTYFEIGRTDEHRKKEPTVGVGLLLDRHQIPVGMKMYPGNESDKPILSDVLHYLKKQNNIKGKTIHVADKGLDCAQSIAFAKRNGDGYLFSKSVNGLSEKEKAWILPDHDFKERKDKNGNILYRYKSCIDQFPYTAEYEGKTVTLNLTEKRLLTYNPAHLLITSEIEMTDQDIYDTYHNLWRTEGLSMMQSDFNASPVFLQKEDTVKGHFLICYLTVLLERILQFKVLKNKYPASEIFNFIRNFKVTKADNKYINATTYSDFIDDLSKLFDLPLTNYFLTEPQIKSMFNRKL